MRIVEPDGGWVLVLPDPADAVTHLWAEGADADAAQALLDEWAAVVEQAGRSDTGCRGLDGTAERPVLRSGRPDSRSAARRAASPT